MCVCAREYVVVVVVVCVCDGMHRLFYDVVTLFVLRSSVLLISCTLYSLSVYPFTLPLFRLSVSLYFSLNAHTLCHSLYPLSFSLTLSVYTMDVLALMVLGDLYRFVLSPALICVHLSFVRYLVSLIGNVHIHICIHTLANVSISHTYAHFRRSLAYAYAIIKVVSHLHVHYAQEHILSQEGTHTHTHTHTHLHAHAHAHTLSLLCACPLSYIHIRRNHPVRMVRNCSIYCVYVYVCMCMRICVLCMCRGSY